MRITAYEEGGKFIGHRVLPVIGLCPGYRHVTLRTEMGQPLTLTTLFLCIVVKVCVFFNTYIINFVGYNYNSTLYIGLRTARLI